MILKNKKGSHVGVVISFVIFILFVVFISVVLLPATEVKNKQNVIDYLEVELIDLVSSDITSASVKISKQNPNDCVQLTDFLSKTAIASKFLVLDEDRELVDADISSSDTGDLLINRGGDIFFKVLESDDFSEAEIGNPASCQPLNEGDGGYILGLVKTNKKIFEGNVMNLIEDYNTDYETLKESLKIGPGNNFGFSFTYGNGTTISATEKNISVNVYVQEIPIFYINKEADTEAGSLNIRAW